MGSYCHQTIKQIGANKPFSWATYHVLTRKTYRKPKRKDWTKKRQYCYSVYFPLVCSLFLRVSQVNSLRFATFLCACIIFCSAEKIMKDDTTTSSSFRRARNLSFRRRSTRRNDNKDKVCENGPGPSQLDSTKMDNERLKVLLENLNFKFTGCTFTYKDSHFDAQPSPASETKKRSRLTALSKQIFGSIERIREAISCEKQYSNCLFVPPTETEKVKDFIRSRFPDMKISFEGCKFLKRSSTIQEKLARNLRKFFGVVFELEYIHAVATVDACTIRLKDISFLNQYVQERIVEEG